MLNGLLFLFIMGVLGDILAVFSQSDLFTAGFLSPNQSVTADYLSTSAELLAGISLAGILLVLGIVARRVGKEVHGWHAVSLLSCIFVAGALVYLSVEKVGFLLSPEQEVALPYDFFGMAGWGLAFLSYFCLLWKISHLSAGRLRSLGIWQIVFSSVFLLLFAVFLPLHMVYSFPLMGEAVFAGAVVAVLLAIGIVWKRMLSPIVGRGSDE